LTLSPVPVESFGGLNLADDPGTVGWGGAIDLLNVDFDAHGRVRTRPGSAKFNAVAAAETLGTPIHVFQQSTSTTHFVTGFGDGTGVGAWNQAGTLVTSDATFGYPLASAAIGTGAAGPYLYFNDWAAGTVRRFDGTVFTTPGGVPAAFSMTLSPTSNRLVIIDWTLHHRVKFSDAGAPETWTAANFVDLHPNDGGGLVGLATWREMVFAFKQNKFFVDALYFVGRNGIFKTTGGEPVEMSGPSSRCSRIRPGSPSSPPPAESHSASTRTPMCRCRSHGRRAGCSCSTARPARPGPGCSSTTLSTAGASGQRPRQASIKPSPPFLTAPPNGSGSSRARRSVATRATRVSRPMAGLRSPLATAPASRTSAHRYASACASGYSKASGSPTLKTSFDFGSLETGAAVTLGVSPAVAEQRRRYAIRGRQFSYQVGGTTAWSLNNLVAHVDERRAPGTHSTT
jgi:hypothetical protein